MKYRPYSASTGLFILLLCSGLGRVGVIADVRPLAQNPLVNPCAALFEDRTVYFALASSSNAPPQPGIQPDTPANSSDSAAPVQDRASIHCPPDIDWEQQLRGRTLGYSRTINGISVERRLNLCSNHSFSYKDNDSYAKHDSNTDFRASMQSGKTGYWQLNANQLMLLWSDGMRSSHILSRRYVEQRDDWSIFLDEEPWANRANRVCP